MLYDREDCRIIPVEQHGEFYLTLHADVSIQILRSMLYRGSEIMREVAWVIFDEIHYMRDAGVYTNDNRQPCREFWSS